MNLYYSRICRKLGLAKTTVWGIAYRKATNFDGILTNKRKEEPFEILPNTDEFGLRILCYLRTMVKFGCLLKPITMLLIKVN